MAYPQADERSIFLQAIEIASTQERAAFLDTACGDNQPLRAAVEALLRAHERPQGLLDAPEVAPTTVANPPWERLDSAVGPYRLLQQIGEGGMGTVFLAEQTHPVRRRVALKVVKPGMDSAGVLARFGAERQALALMDHPNIAKVFDAGQTESGRPYFVMELVQGVPITRFCDERRLTPRQRLELFVPVCQAVQHAHQKGIIHRDLKPSNVLVTLYDGRPVPKVIDFGLAKAVGSRLTEGTQYTEFGAIVGTLEYMSPEQAEPNQLDIDTRSDIYALGALLYELLIGTTPLQRERLKVATLLEALRLIREEEPQRPSTRLETTEELPSIAANRGLEPRRLSGVVRGELDWLVMKCLEKDRNRRYETANSLALDLERYLADEPVQACPPSAGYRLKKFVRRNRGRVAAVGVVLLGLLVGTAGAVVGLVRARQEADGARRARDAEAIQHDRAQYNLSLALKVLDDIYLQVAQDRVPRDPQQEEKEHEMLSKALTFYQEFAEENSADPAVPLEVVRANRRVGDIQRLVGQHAGAGKAYAAAIAKAEQLVKDFPDKPEFSHELAAARNALGELLEETGELAPADEQFRKAAGILQPLTEAMPEAHEYRAELARSHHGLGLTLKRRGERSAAEKEFRQAVDLQAKLAEAQPAVAQYRVDLAEMHRNAGRWYHQGPVDRAANDHLRSAIKLLRELVKHFPAAPAYRFHLAAALENLASQGGPEDYWQEAIALSTQLANDFPTVPAYRERLGISYHNRAEGQMLAGDFVRAAAGYDKAFDLLRKLATDFPKVTRYRDNSFTALHMRATVLIVRDKDLARARPLLEAELRQWRALAKTYPDNQFYAIAIVECGDLLAGILAASGHPAEAAKERRQAEQAFADQLARFAKSQGGPSVAPPYCLYTAGALVQTGNIWLRIDRTAEATAAWRFAVRAYARAFKLDPKSAGDATDFNRLGWGFEGEPRRAAVKKAAAIVEKLLDEIPDGPARKRIRRDVLAVRVGMINTPSPGKTGDTEKLYREAVAVLEQLTPEFSDAPEDRDALARSHYNLAEFLTNMGRSAEAEKAYGRAMAIWAKMATERPERREYRQHLAYAHWNLAAVVMAQKRPQEAEEIDRQGLKHWQQLVDNFPNECWYRNELAFSHGLLGDLLKTTKRPGEAEKAYGRALALQKGIVAVDPTNAGYRLRLAEWHDRLGELLEDHGRLPQAEQERREALALVDKLTSDCAGVPHYRWNLGIRYDHLARLLERAKRPGEAETAYRDAISVWTKLVADYHVEDHRWHLACSHDALGQFCKENGRLEEAAQAYRNARVVWVKLVAEFNHPDRRAHMAWNHGWLLEVLIARARQVENDGKRSEADRSMAAQALRTEVTQLYRDGLQRGLRTPMSINDTAWRLATDANPANRDPALAVELARLAVEREPGSARFANTLGTAFRTLGNELSAAKKSADAEEAYRQARAVHERFPKDEACRQGLAADYFALAYLSGGLGRIEGAATLYRKVIELEPKRAVAYNNLAWLLATCADAKQRRPAEAVALAKRAVELDPKQGMTWNTLGAAHYCAGDWKEAIAALSKSMELRQGGDGFDWFFLAMIHARMGKNEQARKLFDKAVGWMEKNSPRDEELKRFRAEAESVLHQKH
jgi:serine/threonine protein kinase/tetratricopeptide (TPR) repeat protein